ncbi:hypothetical protein BC938DRAFT_482141, partial [Jimgerdemannia flammicorona]
MSSVDSQTLSEFWTFFVYCLVVVTVVVFFLFYFNRALATVLSKIINVYAWRTYHAHIEIDTIPRTSQYTSSRATLPCVIGSGMCGKKAIAGIVRIYSLPFLICIRNKPHTLYPSPLHIIPSPICGKISPKLQTSLPHRLQLSGC